MEVPFNLGYALQLMNIMYSDKIEEKLKEELFSYLSNLEIFYVDYDYNIFLNNILSILSAGKEEHKVSYKLENLEKYEETFRMIKVVIARTFDDSKILEYFNKSLYRSFIEGISRNWKQKKNFKIRINSSTWSRFYLDDRLCEEMKLICFINELAKWIELNYAVQFIEQIECEEYSVLISVKMIK